MELTAAADAWHFACRVARQSPRSLEWKEQKLDRFLTYCRSIGLTDTSQLSIAVVQQFLATLPPQLSDLTHKGYAQVLKTWLRYLASEDLVPPKLPAKLKMPHCEQKVIQTFTPGQLRALQRACDREVFPELRFRDRALIALLADTGIRVSELVRLELEHLHFDRQDAYVTVCGKGRKERQVGLGVTARQALHTYVHRHRRAPADQRVVFLSRDHLPLNPGGVDQLIKRLGRWAGIEGVRCSAHTFRHTFAVNYLAAGGDVYKLARLLGHESVTTTELYLRAFQAQQARRDTRSVLDALRGA